MFQKFFTAKQSGMIAEDLACRHLENEGLTLVEKNYRCRMGEIDLIMQDKTSMIFVEVRFRRNHTCGNGAESVTFHKQRRLIKTALYYLKTKSRYENIDCRFDVVSIAVDNQQIKLEWIRDAFQN